MNSYNFLEQLVEDSETPEVVLNLERLMSVFDKFYPTNAFKRMFKRAFADKVRMLDQNKTMSICLTKHKDTDPSFVISKSKSRLKSER